MTREEPYEPKELAFEAWLQATDIPLPQDDLDLEIALQALFSAFSAGWRAHNRASYGRLN